jgi:hypothetical protein
MSKTRATRPAIEDLDPRTDARAILSCLSCWDFPWDIEKALEFALFRTYAVPEISGVLAQTGEFTERTRKRYDDTELILAEIMEHGADHERGRAAIKQMNRMHGRFRIPNDQYLYVLSTFIFEPIRWLDKFGWRTLTGPERLACFHYYRQLGERMGVRNIPEDIESFEAFNLEYEAMHFRYAETNALIGNKTMDLLLGFYLPRPLFSFARPALHALMDEPLLQAMGYPAPPQWLRATVVTGLKLRARVLGLLPKRKRPHLLTRVKRPTYPNGYAIKDLGTLQD